MKNRFFFIVALLLAFGLFFGGLVWLNIQILDYVEAGEHFLVSWIRARAFLFSGQSPYSEAVLQDVQVAVYGRYALSGEYSYAFDAPFYKLFVYFPFALISNFKIAFAIWLGFAELALAGIGFLSVYLSDWKPSLLSGTLFYLSLFFSFYGFYPLFGGSGAVFTAFFLLLMLLAIREEWDEALGLLLLFGTFYPAKGGILFLLILVWLAYQGRWQVFSIAFMSMIMLGIVSFLILPSWLSAYYEVLSGTLNLRYGYLFSAFLMQFSSEYNVILAEVLRWLFLVILLAEWVRARARDFSHLLWVAALSLVLVPFFEMPVSAYFFSLFLFPLPLILKSIEDRWQHYARPFSVFVLLLTLTAWFGFSRYENNLLLLTFIPPLFLTLGLYWVRWWSLRAPRTWWDDAHNFKKPA